MKFLKFLNPRLRSTTAVLGVLALAGCSVLDPADSQKTSNTPPETQITSGPKQGATASYFVTIAWKGEDGDGVIKGFNLTVDGQTFFTTNTDSTFKFTAANQDEQHSLSVAAVDNEDAVDASPATLSFTATNQAPNTALEIEGNPAPGAIFGRGGVFKIVPIDDSDNGPEYSYRFKIDDNGQWSQWLNTEVIEFSTTSSFGLLPEGAHKFIAQVRDAAQAVDPTPVEFPIVVSGTVKPTAAVTALFNSQAFYEDRSAFSFASGNTVAVSWSVSYNYAGARSTGSRYRIDGGAWTNYSTEVSSLNLTNVTPGAHTFEVQYRDLAGIESDIALFDYEIVTPTKDQGILVIDDGNGQFAGRPPATGDANADAYYTQILTALGARFTLYDILAQGNPTPKRGMGKYSTVIWASDEAPFAILQRQLQLATDYLNVGGKMWIVGWRAINQIAGTTPVASFAPNANSTAAQLFIWNYLKIASTRQTPGNVFEFTGATGQNGHPNVNVDNPKNPIPGRNGLSPIDLLTVRSDVPAAQPIYAFNTFSGNAEYQDGIVGMKYLGTDFRVVVFGFPLYHLKAAEAQAATQKILQDLGEI